MYKEKITTLIHPLDFTVGPEILTLKHTVIFAVYFTLEILREMKNSYEFHVSSFP